MNKQNFISADFKTARNSYDDYFIIVEIVIHKDETVGEAIIKSFSIDSNMNEIKVITSKGYAYLDFLVKLKKDE